MQPLGTQPRSFGTAPAEGMLHDVGRHDHGFRPMPITAKLSRKLYETFGEQAAGDMVDWMQRVDAQRAELRELNELDFARLDARLDRLEERFNQFGREMHAQFAQLEVAIVGRLEAKIGQRTADLMKWSFMFWVGAVAAIAALAGVMR